MNMPRPQDAMRPALTLILVFAFCGALAALFKFVVPEKNVDLVNFMLGQLSVMAVGCVGYYMQTSKSSSEKNVMFASRPPGDPANLDPNTDYPTPKFGDR
jgi:hypothetical protein